MLFLYLIEISQSYNNMSLVYKLILCDSNHSLIGFKEHVNDNSNNLYRNKQLYSFYPKGRPFQNQHINNLISSNSIFIPLEQYTKFND